MNNNITTIIRIALATIAMAIATSCADHLDHQDPLTPHTPGQLGIATITLNQSATATPATRATLEDGTTITSTDGMMLISPNTAITTLTDGEQLLATYNFTDKDPDAPDGDTYKAVAQRSTGSNPAQWQFIATGANDLVLRPNAKNEPTSAETWQDTRLALTLTGKPDGTPATGTIETYAGMNTITTTDVPDPEDGTKTITTRLFYDALRATTDATTKRGTVTIDLTPQSPTLGRLSAAMAHVGALMTLKDDDITGTIISGATGINITADNITAIYAIVKYDADADASTNDDEFHVPFTHVATGTTPAATGTPNAWQAIVPAGAKVQKFIVQAAPDAPSTPAAPSTTVTIPINLPDEKTLNADYRYPLTLALNGSKAQITLTLPAKPGWGTPADEQEITDGTAYLKHIGGTGADANNPLRYEVSHPLGLRLLQQWINSEIDPNNTGKAPKTTIANSDVHSRLATHITLTADMDMTLLPTITTGTYTGSNWTPIGTSSAHYTGTFDGNGYTIKNMKVKAEITTSDDTYAALFARITGATIKNLTMTDAVVSATGTGTQVYAAAVAAEAYDSHIENCKVVATTPGTPGSSTISATTNNTGSNNFSYAGSIAGNTNTTTTIIACSNTACAATATATGSRDIIAYAGGIVGSNSGTIIACISTGVATATATATDVANRSNAYYGGIIGRSIDIDTGTTIACYTTQPINNQTGGITADQYGTKVDGGLPAINTTAKITEINTAIDAWNITAAATPAQQCPYHYQVTGTSGSDAMPATVLITSNP